ncbi:MAG: nucleotide sugar dehydrogenase [bacterium]|nr:nucleotide sugar dehydrogenase [bacterium]
MTHFAASKNIAVVGLWHLGSVYAASLAKMGFTVYGFDFDKKAVGNLKKGVPPIFEPELKETIEKHLNKNLLFSDSRKILHDKKYIFVTHDLEVDANDIVNTDVLEKTFSLLLKHSADDSIIVISSQVPVGTSRILVNLLKNRGIEDPKVIYFPENLRLGNAFASFLNPDRVVLGSENPEALGEFQKDFTFKCPVITMGLESAEMVKHALNSYLATCISFSSELSDLSEKIGADMVDVVKALKLDRRVSPYAPINPGLGFAGGTLGRDIQTLRKIAKDNSYEPKLLNAVYDVNRDRLPMLVSKINSVYPILKGKTIGILGLTYKPNTNTLRRAVSLELLSMLKGKGCKLKAFDPAIKHKIADSPFIKICTDVEDLFKGSDLIILMTEWPEFLKIDVKKLSLLMNNKVIIDTKNFLESAEYKKNGFTYVGIGVIGLTQSDAVRGASEACDQAVHLVPRGSKPSTGADQQAVCRTKQR